ncbi:DHB2-like protein [Mya arenaria]|uniref:DHB2-like protein n=1 Tax=Mya arenaria TaxID=6604 RepID=A0ABY7E9W3_MYAAR|nr:DHB2-like protein [Mya arenaria]
MPLTDIYRIMAINFLGPLNMCLAPVPHMGVYCASKAALAMFTESLRFEQKVWGVHVSTVVPSGYRTGIMAYDKDTTAKRWWKEASPTVKHDLGQDCFKPEFKYKNHESHTTPDLSSIVDTISYALSVKYPKPFYYSGFLARTLPYVYHYLPPALSDIAVEVLASWFEFKPQALQPHHQLNGMMIKELCPAREKGSARGTGDHFLLGMALQMVT